MDHEINEMKSIYLIIRCMHRLQPFSVGCNFALVSGVTLTIPLEELCPGACKHNSKHTTNGRNTDGVPGDAAEVQVLGKQSTPYHCHHCHQLSASLRHHDHHY